MIYETHKADITFQKTFHTLAFDVVKSGVEILREVSKRIGPRYYIRTEDMSVHGGTNLSDVRVNVVMFNGAGELQVTPERLFLRFSNIRGEDDLKIIKDVVLLAEDSIKSTIPNVAFKEDVIQLAAHLRLVDKSVSAGAVLDNLCSGSAMMSRLSASRFGASEIHFSPKSDIENNKELWRVTYELARSVFGSEFVFLSGMATYVEGGAQTSIEQKFSHAEKITDQFLKGLGLETDEIE